MSALFFVAKSDVPGAASNSFLYAQPLKAASPDECGHIDTCKLLPKAPGYLAIKVCLSESNADSCELKLVSFLTTSAGGVAPEF